MLALAGLHRPSRWLPPASAAEAAPGHEARGKLPPWSILPQTPTLPAPSRAGLVEVDGASIHYAQFGSGRDLLMLHGGLANSNYWGLQVGELAKHHTVTVMDTRGHGRSPYGGEALSYDLFARDVLKLLDRLGISRTALVGWSDGGITALLVAAGSPDRVSHLFAYGANISLSGLRPGGSHAATFETFAARCATEYRTLSPRAAMWPRLVSSLSRMWRAPIDLAAGRLHRIACPTVIADGRYDEIIRPEHPAAIASRIEHAQKWIQADASHFGMLQDSCEFNRALAAALAK